MFRILARVAAAAAAFFCLVPAIYPQQCKAPEIVFNKDAGNIFTEEQEMYLGDAIAEQIQRDYRILDDATINAYLDKIGARLTRNLPPTNLKFRFSVVDIPEVNAFAFPGGRIFVTRKLIAFVRSEDELAGILAHELGHGIVRHGSIDLSKAFREILKVTSFGDRKDVFEKYNQLLDRQNTKRVKTSRSHEGDQQLEADRIGVYAMTAAGYDPEAFSSAFDRLAGTEGKTGSWFSDLFGSTTPAEKRLREIIGAIKQMPSECIARGSVGTAEEFADWQTSVVALSTVSREEILAGLVRRTALAPGMRDQIRHFEFSRDGSHIIAQDRSSIFVLQTSPFEYLFRIDAPAALKAGFSPDSKHIVFSTPTMRIEKWEIASRQPEFVREVYLREGCIQSTVSNDGEMLVCFYPEITENDLMVGLKLVDVRSNETLHQDKKFLRLDPVAYISFQVQALLAGQEAEREMFQTAFSPDGRYFVAGRVFKTAYRPIQVTLGMRGRATVRAGDSGTIGYDLQKKELVKLGGELIDRISSPFAFYSNNSIIGQDDQNQEKSGIFEFPSGKRIAQFPLLADSLSKSHKGDYVLVRPIKVAPVGVYNPMEGKILLANNNSALDVYGNLFVAENKAGEIGLLRVDKDEAVGFLELPESRLGGIRALEVSPDLNWLAISTADRGSVWSLYSGKRMFYVNPFRGAFFDKSGKVYADFPGDKNTSRQIGVLDLASGQIVENKNVASARATQHGQFLISIKPMQEDGKKKKRDVSRMEIGKLIDILNDPPENIPSAGILEVRDIRDNNLVWSREFEDEIPERYVSSLNDAITLVWPLRSTAARKIVESDAALKSRAAALGDRDGDYFIQVVESATGKVIGQTFIETGSGSFRVLEAESSGDYLAFSDSENRVQVFSLSTGELLSRNFGRNFALNSVNGTIAIGNEAGRLTVYEIRTGQTVERMSFTSPIAYAQYDKYGKKLLVVTSEQEVFIFDCAKFGAEESVG